MRMFRKGPEKLRENAPSRGYGGMLLLSALSVGLVAAMGAWSARETEARRESGAETPALPPDPLPAHKSAAEGEPMAARPQQNSDRLPDRAGVQKPRPAVSANPNGIPQKVRHNRSAEEGKPEQSTRDGQLSDSKMVSGGQELRDHDFAFPDQAGEGANERVREDMHEADPAAVRSGGEQDAEPGDKPARSLVGAIQDQDLSTPDLAQERG